VVSTGVTRALTKLSPVDVAILHLYLHAIVERLRLSITPLAQETTQDTHTPCSILVCGDCYTLRSKARGFGRSLKGGILIDIQKTNAISCSSCLSSNIIPVSINKQTVTAPVASDGNTATIVICARCQLPMVLRVNSVIGTHYLCTSCLAKTQSEMTPCRCFCGVPINSRGRSIKMFIALDKNSNLSMYAACEKHEHVIPEKEIVNIRVIESCIDTNVKLQRTQKHRSFFHT